MFLPGRVCSSLDHQANPQLDRQTCDAQGRRLETPGSPEDEERLFAEELPEFEELYHWIPNCFLAVCGLRHVCFFSKPPAYIPTTSPGALVPIISVTAMVPSIGKWKRRPMFGCQVWMPKSLKLTSRPMPFCMFMVGCTRTWTRVSDSWAAVTGSPT